MKTDGRIHVLVLTSCVLSSSSSTLPPTTSPSKPLLQSLGQSVTSYDRTFIIFCQA